MPEVSMPAFQHIVIVMFENASRDTVLENAYMRGLRSKGAFLANSHGVTHPSQPNYIAMVGGDLLGIDSDTPGWVHWQGHSNYPPTSITSIVDLLENAGKTWKAYAEDYDLANKLLAAETPPSQVAVPYESPDQVIPPDPSADGCLFARKHVPFLSFPNIVDDPQRVQCIVDLAQLDKDLAAGTLPNYCFVVPNLLHDGHNAPSGDRSDPFDTQNLVNIQAFLEQFLTDDPWSRFPAETLIVLTFDESYPVTDPYNIYTLLLGDMLQPGTVRMEPYNHYSLLRSVQVNFGLGSLNRNDLAANPYWFLQGL
jgi:hypothetical protein